MRLTAWSRSRFARSLLLACAACSGSGQSEAGGASGQPAPVSAAAPGQSPSAPAGGRGIEVRTGEGAAQWLPWESEQTVNAAIRALPRPGGGTITFAPGEYEIRFGILLAGVHGVTLRGGPGVRLVFPARMPDPPPQLVADVPRGATHLQIAPTDGLRQGGSYQVYPADRRGDRLLEFTVAALDGDGVRLPAPVAYMGHVNAIPAGSPVLESWNFFRIINANDVTIEGFTLDGRGHGGVDGHTIYSGILAQNQYRPNATERPAVRGLTVRGNVLRGLQGRGIAVYSVGDFVCEDNVLEDIRREAIEVDHYAGGRVRNNRLVRCDVGVALDDAFDTLVEGNVFEQCRSGIHFVRHFDDAWVNTGNVARNNRINGPGYAGIKLADRTRGNVVRDNHIVGVQHGVIPGGENEVVGNVVEK